MSFFANDLGDFKEALDGKGDWEEAGYWMSRISQYCFSKSAECVMVPAPWVNQIEGPQRAGNYPGKLANILEVVGHRYFDPMPAFANAQLETVEQGSPAQDYLREPARFLTAESATAISRRGAEIWASAVGRRVALLLERRRLAEKACNAGNPSL